MRNIKELSLKGKKVLVRCDFNVPVSEDGKVLDDFRIKVALSTINYLKQHAAQIILMSHLQPTGELLSLRILIPKLEQLLQSKIFFLEDYLSDNAPEKINEARPKIILLENLRFHKQEKQNDLGFAKKLSRLGDIYINEAFSVCHREHASVCAITKFMPSAAGLNLEKEIKYLSSLTQNPERPFVVIIGGIKIQTKIEVVLNIIDIADQLLLGSKLAEVILAEKGKLKDRNLPKIDLLNKLDLTNPKLHIPIDGHIGSSHLKIQKTRKDSIETMKKQEEVYDIGPKTIEMFKGFIQKASTILWNGPLGMYENKRFEEGTKEIAHLIINNKSALKVAGGGETVDAIGNLGLMDEFDFISSGGGAMLKFLSGQQLPGIECLMH